MTVVAMLWVFGVGAAAGIVAYLRAERHGWRSLAPIGLLIACVLIFLLVVILS